MTTEYAYESPFSLKLSISELNSSQHVIDVTAETSVHELEVAIEEKIGPPRKRQRLLYQETVLQNRKALSAYAVTPLQPNLSLVQIQPERVYVIGTAAAQVCDTNEQSWTRLNKLQRPAIRNVRHTRQAIGIGDKLFLLEYMKDEHSDDEESSRVYVYDPSVDSWSVLPPLIEHCRSRAAMATISQGVRTWGRILQGTVAKQS